MDPNAWIMLLVGIAVTSGLFALGVVLYPKLKTEKQGYPFTPQELLILILSIVIFGASGLLYVFYIYRIIKLKEKIERIRT